MTTVVASVNVLFTLSNAHARDALFDVLAERPHLVALQEFGPARDRILNDIPDHSGPYQWTRPKTDGDPAGPVLWHKHRFQLRAANAVRLARREYVGHLPGRKDRLAANYATEVILDGLEPDESQPNARHPDGTQTVLLNFHLTAEIQDVRGGGGYKKELKYRLRVARHKRERRRLEQRARAHLKKGRTVYVAGDGNFTGLELAGLVNCWQGRKGGTLGGRAVDIVFGARRPAKLWTKKNASDHDALVVVYP